MRNLYQVDATTGATHQLLPLGTAYNPIALAYDSTARMLYWTDVAAKTVNRYSMITNTSIVIYWHTNVGKYGVEFVSHFTLEFARSRHYFCRLSLCLSVVSEVS